MLCRFAQMFPIKCHRSSSLMPFPKGSQCSSFAIVLSPFTDLFLEQMFKVKTLILFQRFAMFAALHSFAIMHIVSSCFSAFVLSSDPPQSDL